jgi:hypothetical protein
VKKEHWLPPLVFLGVAVPVVLVLNMLDIGGDYRIWIALGAGVLATAVAQSRLKSGGPQ